MLLVIWVLNLQNTREQSKIKEERAMAIPTKEEMIQAIEREKDPMKKIALQSEFLMEFVDDDVLTKAFNKTTRNLYRKEIAKMAAAVV